jgi:hypothetical protein
MARRQRTLYEFVDRDDLAAGEIASETREPSASPERRRFTAGRVAAGLALLAGLCCSQPGSGSCGRR